MKVSDLKNIIADFNDDADVVVYHHEHEFKIACIKDLGDGELTITLGTPDEIERQREIFAKLNIK